MKNNAVNFFGAALMSTCALLMTTSVLATDTDEPALTPVIAPATEQAQPETIEPESEVASPLLVPKRVRVVINHRVVALA